jgi:hypothetical protein
LFWFNDGIPLVVESLLFPLLGGLLLSRRLAETSGACFMNTRDNQRPAVDALNDVF